MPPPARCLFRRPTGFAVPTREINYTAPLGFQSWPASNPPLWKSKIMALVKSEKGLETINQWAASPRDPGRREGEGAPVGCRDGTERTALEAQAQECSEIRGSAFHIVKIPKPTCPSILSTPSNSISGGVLGLRTRLSTLGVVSLPSVGVSSVTLFLPTFLWSCFPIV